MCTATCMICKVTENPCKRLRIEGPQVPNEVWFIFIWSNSEVQFCRKQKLKLISGKTEDINTQDFILFTQVTITSCESDQDGVTEPLQLHLTQEWWQRSALTKFPSQGDLEGFSILHINCLAKTFHFQLWSGRQGYIQEATVFGPSPQMPQVTSIGGKSCKEWVKTGCSTQPKTWLSLSCHIIESIASSQHAYSQVKVNPFSLKSAIRFLEEGQETLSEILYWKAVINQ